MPHNYTSSIPSTLPPSILGSDISLNTISQTTKKAYINIPQPPSQAGEFVTKAFHPSDILRIDNALLLHIQSTRRNAEKKVLEWEESIKNRDLQEKRRKAPGWLDGEVKLLEPENVHAHNAFDKEPSKIMTGVDDLLGLNDKTETKSPDLGKMMDQAFGTFSDAKHGQGK